MTSQTTGFKRKLHNALGNIHPLALPLSLIFGAAAALGPVGYYNFYGSEGESAAAQAEYTAIEKRIEAIVPMRTYVKTAQEQAEVVLRLPADALPAGTDVKKMEEQGKRLSAAYETEVRGVAIDITHARDISFSDMRDLGTKLQAAYGKTIDYTVSGGSSMAMVFNIHACQASVLARPGVTRGEESARQIKDCATDHGKPYFYVCLGGLLVFAVCVVGGGPLQRTLGHSIEKEDAARAAADALQPRKIEAAVESGTGQDITIKPIKITGKAPAA
jgi:hypothetical protein